jgi:hypothetical protein
MALFIYKVLICRKKVILWMGKGDIIESRRKNSEERNQKRSGRRQESHSSEAVSYPPLEGARGRIANNITKSKRQEASVP